MFGKKGPAHRALETGMGNEGVADCLSVCYLNSSAMVWTEEGLCSPLQTNFLLLGLEVSCLFVHVYICKTVSAKYVGLSDKSSKNWFGPVKIVIGPVKIFLIKFIDCVWQR